MRPILRSNGRFEATETEKSDATMKVTSNMKSGQGILIVKYGKPVVIQCNDRLFLFWGVTNPTRLRLLPLYILYHVFVATLELLYRA